MPVSGAMCRWTAHCIFPGSGAADSARRRAAGIPVPFALKSPRDLSNPEPALVEPIHRTGLMLALKRVTFVD
jgi:hypothetical protein